MTEPYPTQPRDVPRVETAHRRIVTPIPAPDSLAIIKRLRRNEPRSMGGQPLVVWDRAEGVHVFDRFGNRWLDFTSGVLVANAGHNHPSIRKAMLDQIDHGLVHNYCFPSEIRAELVNALAAVAPDGLDKVFLLTTGSEATECAIKLARTAGIERGGTKKIAVVTFTNAFHGRTLGAQMAGGIAPLKQWIVNHDRDIVQIPFPDGFRNPHTDFTHFERGLKELGYTPDRIAGVMTETYQGGDSAFAPVEYVKALRAWCNDHDVVLAFDEVQAGFGRTGKFWGFEHYGVTPDLICCGKGITSGMPLSAVIGRAELMDLYPPGSMTSTHTGNPVCCAAALANLRVIRDEKLVENAAAVGALMQGAVRKIGERFKEHIGAVMGKGLVASLHMVERGTTEPDPARAKDIVRRCVEKGLMLFSPVGYRGASVKLSPPLCIDEAAMREGVGVVEEAVEESVREMAVVGVK